MAHTFRSGKRNIRADVTIYQPVAGLPWWNPDGLTPGGVGGSCVGAYQGRAAANYASSLSNLANPGTNDLVEGNGVVPWAAGTGWGFVAAALQYFDTGLIPPITQMFSVLIQYANVVGAATYLLGCRDGAQRFYIRPNAGGMVEYRNGSTKTSVAPALLTGNLGIAGNQGYRNGVAEGGLLGAYTGPMAQPAYVGCWNVVGVPGGFITADIYALAFYNVTLTVPQVALRAAAMAAL